MTEKNSNQPFPIEYGKLPPQALELEEAILGAIILESGAIHQVIDLIKPDSFYKDENRKIYTAIVNLANQNKSIDLLTVTEELRNLEWLEECGGIAYVTGLTSRIGSSVGIEDHAKIVHQKYMQRELIRVCTEIQNKAYDNSIDVADLLDYAENEILAINTFTKTSVIYAIAEIFTERAKLYEEIQKSGKKFSGVPSGLTKFDRITLGFQGGDLIILAARPSIGKTQFMLHFAFNAAIFDFKIGIVSYEMSKEQLVDRIFGIASQINPMKARMGLLDKEDWIQVETWIRRFIETKIFIIDDQSISITKLRSKGRRLRKDYEIDILMIDYLQLMPGLKDSSTNREQEVSHISRNLKGMAKELNIPIIALSQLNRLAEGVRPNLSHLRESGAIEQDADLVVFPYREKESGILSLDGELILSKHRNGALGTFLFSFNNKAMTKLTEQDEFDNESSSDYLPESIDLEEKPPWETEN